MATQREPRNGARATAGTARAFTRRSLLKGAVAAGTVAGIGPWFVREARSQSGTLNLATWSDYMGPAMVEDFQKKTGVKLNISVYGSNDEPLNKLRASRGKGVDLVMPSITYTPTWLEYDLLQPLDEKKVNVSGCVPAIWKSSEGLGAIKNGKRFAAPFNWGTEAITYDTTVVKKGYGEISFATLWQPEYKGKVTVRARSALLGIGLAMESTGQLPKGAMKKTYTDERHMRDTYEKITKMAIERKSWVRQFWNNAQETTAAFLQNGCVIGQTWDGPAARMKKETQGRISYIAPKEGALTWMDSMAIPVGAENIAQAYAFINWYYTPEAGALHANATGYNTVAAGAEKLLSADAKKFFQEAYPGDAIPNLWWYPPEPAWFVAARNEYQDRFLAA